jgi:hypothetical protein
MRPLKKRCRILPAGGLGVPLQLQKVPQSCGIRGLIETISAVSKYMVVPFGVGGDKRFVGKMLVMA